jgi:EAL domain-containing protein (putative c-di-GMP-specific phosphodiesterase class I)
MPKRRANLILRNFIRLPAFSIAFQPIVDVQRRQVYAFEALVRGRNGQGYPDLIAHLSDEERRIFDRLATSKALRIAARHRSQWQGARLSLNLRPDHERAAEDARHVLRRAMRYGIDPSLVVLELTEDVKIGQGHLRDFIEAHRQCGFATAIDDFGAGYAGLTCLAEDSPSILKLDRALTRNIQASLSKQRIVGSFISMCAVLGVDIVVEGVETPEEYATLERLGVRLMQGYLLGRPALEAFQEPAYRNSSLTPMSWTAPLSFQGCMMP